MKFHLSPLDLVSSRVKAKIAAFLLTHEAAMSEREIASILKVSHMSVNRTLREFSGTNFVSYVRAGQAHLWKVNRQSYAYNIVKTLLGGAGGAPDPLTDLVDTILDHLPLKLIDKICLYGSLAKGTEKPDSDIDLFILAADDKARPKIEKALAGLSDLCLAKYGNRLEANVMTRAEFRKKGRLGIASEILAGRQIFPAGEKK